MLLINLKYNECVFVERMCVDRIMINLNELGAHLREYRKKSGITQDKVAEILKLSKYHVSDLERGKHKLSVNILVEYCKLLDMTPDEVLEFHREGNAIIPDLARLLSEKDKEEQERILRVIQALY